MSARMLTVSIFVLAGIFPTLSCCRKGNVSAGDSKQEVAASQIKDLEEAFKFVGTWQTYIEASHHKRFSEGGVGRKINDVKDPVTRMKYFKRLYDLAFSVPLDAADPATRSHQLASFRMLTDDARRCAEEAEDMYYKWETRIRRLKIVKAEMQKVEAFLNGKEGRDTFKGSCYDWESYRRKVRESYNYDAQELSWYFDDTWIVDGLTYEQWHSMRSQLEKILERKMKMQAQRFENREKAKDGNNIDD